MTNSNIESLVETRKRVIKAVLKKEMSVSCGANLLGITRQGLWKIKNRVKKQGFGKYPDFHTF